MFNLLKLIVASVPWLLAVSKNPNIQYPGREGLEISRKKCIVEKKTEFGEERIIFCQINVKTKKMSLLSETQKDQHQFRSKPKAFPINVGMGLGEVPGHFSGNMLWKEANTSSRADWI